MKNIKYGIVEEIYHLNGEVRTSYGIVVYSNADIDGTSTIIGSVRDITSDKDVIETFAQKLSLMELSPIHLKEVVEDFLVC